MIQGQHDGAGIRRGGAQQIRLTHFSQHFQGRRRSGWTIGLKGLGQDPFGHVQAEGVGVLYNLFGQWLIHTTYQFGYREVCHQAQSVGFQVLWIQCLQVLSQMRGPGDSSHFGSNFRRGQLLFFLVPVPGSDKILVIGGRGGLSGPIVVDPTAQKYCRFPAPGYYAGNFLQ